MQSKIKLNIKEWAEEDRPREKMLSKGAGALSNAELLAILIGSGNKEETAVELTKRILASCNNNIHILGKKTTKDLCSFRGIGLAKAISIEAALELGRRRKLPELTNSQIKCSYDIYELFHPLLCDLHIEEFWLLLLNQSCKVIKRLKISTGGISSTVVDTRTILREALIERATSIAICHNHPSGNNNPSRADNDITYQLQKAAKLMDICLIDHLIICDGNYYSYADEGKLILT